MYQLLDLFSGIGGFSLGLERSGGFKTVAFCEREPFACAILKHHWPKVPVYDDVRSLTVKQLHADGVFPDTICGGFPCQDISVAGKGLGLKGERSGLWSEYARLISELRPKYVLVENVSALLVRGLDTVLGDLASIGYDAEWHCIPASYLGAWHQRDRVWILAYPVRVGKAGAARPIFRQSHLSMQLARSFEEWPGRSNLPESRFRREDDGVPRRVDKGRNKALGNAVVPQVPELLGRAIIAAENKS